MIQISTEDICVSLEKKLFCVCVISGNKQSKNTDNYSVVLVCFTPICDNSLGRGRTTSRFDHGNLLDDYTIIKHTMP